MTSTTLRRWGARVACALALTLACGTVTALPAAADDPVPTMTDPSFDGRSWTKTQHYHAAFVSPGVGGEGSAVQLGFDYEAGSKYPVNGNLPTLGQMPNRGMVNKIVSNIKPNTQYRFELYTKGPNIQYGIFDTESEFPYIGNAAGERQVSSTDWVKRSVTITTGPRTTELNAFCFMYENAGPNWCDEFSVTEVGPAVSPKTAPTQWTSDPPLGTNGFPVTIPAVQSFTPTAPAGTWAIPAKPNRIWVPAAQYSALSADARTFATELAKALGSSSITVSSLPATTTPAANEIVYQTGTVDVSSLNARAKGLASQAYYLDVVANGPITITGGGADGAFWGAQTFMQAVKGHTTLPTGRVFDWTDQGVRGLQVDSARRYYSIDWLQNHIKDLAYTKMNYLVLRVKDSQGLRIQSTVAPELTDLLPDGGSWSKAEITTLVNTAKQYHVTIIPEVDMPGHALMDEQVYPQMMKRTASGEGYVAYDYTDPEVRDFLTRLAREVGAAFQAPYVHLGGDEFLGAGDAYFVNWAKSLGSNYTAQDAYRILFNEVNAGLKKDGRSAWMFDDMLKTTSDAVPLSKDIRIVYWAQIYGSLSADAMAAAGYELIGSSSDLYHDLWPPINRYKDKETINWPLPEYQWTTYNTPFVFSRGFSTPATLAAANQGQVLGQLFPIWDDAHGWAPEYVLTQTLAPRLRIHAQTAWNSPRPVTTFADFDPYLRYLGHAPTFVQGTETLGVFTMKFDWPQAEVSGHDVVVIPAGALAGFRPYEYARIYGPDGTTLLGQAYISAQGTNSSAVTITFPYDNFGIPDGLQTLKAMGSVSGRYVTAQATFTAEPRATYKVEFMLNDGTSAVHETKQVLEGETATAPAANPTRLAADFKGWYTNAAATTAWNPATVITKDTQVFAGWTIWTRKLAVSPSTADPGQVLTFTGTGFAPGEVSVLSSPLGAVATFTATADAAGAFTSSIQLPYSVESGSIMFTAADSTKTKASQFVVINALSISTPTLAVSDAAPRAGSTITVAGAGFKPGPITLAWDVAGSTPVSLTAAANGTFFAEVTVPAAGSGAAVLTASDAVPASATAALAIVPLPSLSASAASVAAGSSVTVTGASFAPDVAVTLSGLPTGSAPTSAVTDATGAFSLAVTIPATASRGPYTVTATDAHDWQASLDLAVTKDASLQAAPASIVAGSTVTVSGADFSPLAAVTLSGAPAGSAPLTATADAHGAFAVEIVVPLETAAASFTLVATDAESISASAPLTVTAAPLAYVVEPEISGTPQIGNTLSVTAGQYAPAADQVTYRWLRDGQPIAQANEAAYTVARADGGTRLSVEVIATRAGVNPLITVLGPLEISTAAFVVDSAPEVAGSGQVGGPLAVTPGTYTPTPDQVTYQWLRDGTPIPGATGSRYTPTDRDAGHVISVRVTASGVGLDPAISTVGSIAVPGKLPDTGRVALDQPLYRFYKNDGTHFYTTSASEADQVRTYAEYSYEGIAGYLGAGEVAGDGQVVLHRFYKNDGTHFYTANATEAAAVKTYPEYSYEGVVGVVDSAARGDNTAMHRFYKFAAGTHFYTSSEHEAGLVKGYPEYRYESVAYYLAPGR